MCLLVVVILYLGLCLLSIWWLGRHGVHHCSAKYHCPADGKTGTDPAAVVPHGDCEGGGFTQGQDQVDGRGRYALALAECRGVTYSGEAVHSADTQTLGDHIEQQSEDRRGNGKRPPFDYIALTVVDTNIRSRDGEQRQWRTAHVASIASREGGIHGQEEWE